MSFGVYRTWSRPWQRTAWIPSLPGVGRTLDFDQSFGNFTLASAVAMTDKLDFSQTFGTFTLSSAVAMTDTLNLSQVFGTFTVSSGTGVLITINASPTAPNFSLSAFINTGSETGMEAGALTPGNFTLSADVTIDRTAAPVKAKSVTAPKRYQDATNFALGLMGQKTPDEARGYIGVNGLSVVTFGMADRSGVRDATAAFNLTIETAGVYGIVDFPAGLYRIEGVLYYYTGQTWRGERGGPQGGDSLGTFLKRTGEETGPMIRPALTNSDTINVYMSNLRIEGGPRTGMGIYWNRVNYGALWNVLIYNCDVGLCLDSSGGQCYFSDFFRCNISYNRVTNVRLQNGANDNDFWGLTTGGSPRSIECLTDSSANNFWSARCQGQAAPDDTQIHIYLDAPSNKFHGTYVEGSSVVQAASAGTTTTLTLPAMGASPNQYAGYTALFLSGAGAGQEAVILSNTGTVLTFAAAVSVAGGSDTVIQITRTVGFKMTRNGGSGSLTGTTWGGGIARDVDDGGTASISGTASGATAGIPHVAAATLFKDGLVTTTNQYQFYSIVITGGLGSGQKRLLSGSSYDAIANRTTFTVNNDWSTVPDGTSTFQLYEPKAYAYVRKDLKATAGTGDPRFRFRDGVLQMESEPNGETLPFDWFMEPSLGIENVLYRFGRKTKTEGTHRSEYWHDQQLLAFIDHKTGGFHNNTNFGWFQIGLNCRFANSGLGMGGIQIYDAGGPTWRSSVMGDLSVTAGDTRLLVWDVNKASLARVSVGANDSGGAGFKLLRVPN